MKRGGPLKRTTPLARTGQLARGKPLDRRTLSKAPDGKIKASRRDTGPSPATVKLLSQRSGGFCEWPGCNRQATDRHHRLNRKQGGRHGEMAQRVNGVAWLLHCCRTHHADVTSVAGEALAQAKEWGWVLTEGQDGEAVPALTRHSTEPVLLEAGGGWMTF